MSSLSSKQIRSNISADILLTVAFVLVLAMLTLYNSQITSHFNFDAARYQFSGASTGIATAADMTFTSDKQYWSANCSHGWRSDATCESILLRAKVCDLGADTAYCSKYATYIQQIREQVKQRQNFPTNKVDV